MRIALVAPPLLPVPPGRYGGVERIVGVLAHMLHDRGHDVTLFAPGDSDVPCRLVATVPDSLWREGSWPDPSAEFARTTRLVLEAADEFDVIHSHLDHHGFELARRAPVPVVSTIHGRTDTDPLAGLLARDGDLALVAISHSQRTFVPQAGWLATIHHGLPFAGTAAGDGRGGYLLFVGRLSHDKGVRESVEVARLSGLPLRMAAKAFAPNEIEVYETIVEPAVSDGVVEFMGEVDAQERDELIGDAVATIMLSRWPEPFGLVAIESLAMGTPVIAQRSGALPEIVVHGHDGFVVDGPAEAAAALELVDGLDREGIRLRALRRFAADRMVDQYLDVYARVAGSQALHSERR